MTATGTDENFYKLHDGEGDLVLEPLSALKGSEGSVAPVSVWLDSKYFTPENYNEEDRFLVAFDGDVDSTVRTFRRGLLWDDFSTTCGEYDKFMRIPPLCMNGDSLDAALHRDIFMA